jgi:hypothetical protein
VRPKHHKRQTKPKEGTFNRIVYDTFQTNKGRVINVHEHWPKKSIQLYSSIENLNLFYHQDIRAMKYGGFYCLCGEIKDGQYIDYVIAVHTQI